MNFENVSLLMNWLELGALFAILSRLARTFDLIASTQRELRRAIHHLGEHNGFPYLRCACRYGERDGS